MNNNAAKSPYRSIHRERGFTLVELLIVIAIIGVLAAIILPNVSGLSGAGETESAAAELVTVQSAMDVMMVKIGLSAVTATSGTNDMSAFPAGNPLYPNYLRSATTQSYYSCTTYGLVSEASGGSTPETSTPATSTAPPTTTTTAAYPDWSSGTPYNGGSYVSYNGGVYYARYYASENQTPGLVSSPWQEVTAEWRNFNVYEDGDTVSYNGAQFEARNWSQNQTPGLIASPWQELTDEWRSFNIYQGGETVSYNGHQYRAKYYTQNNIPGSSDPWQLVN